MAEVFRCHGCEAVSHANASIPPDTKGAYTGFIPFDDTVGEGEEDP
jgi:hypothetical protein